MRFDRLSIPVEHHYPAPEIVWEDGPCLVVNKPGGLQTQAPSGIDSMEFRLRRHLLERENRSGNMYIVPCHRLDRPVCGLILFARNVRAARRLATQFEHRTVRKAYWAFVEGTVTPAESRWTDFMRKIPGEPRSEIVSADHPDAQYAAMNYRVIESTPAGSLLDVDLETGRTHQIRLQAAARGWPIKGDVLYGAATPFGPTVVDERLRWIALWARQLAFIHPMSQAPIELVGPVPEPWRALDLSAWSSDQTNLASDRADASDR
jgi:RluA family pseudouridine synthase